MKTSSQLEELYQTIRSFQIVKCEMYHERVAIGAKGIPIASTSENTVVFKRVSLCNTKDRNMRLGCAHSKVNVHFKKVLTDLENTFPDEAHRIVDFKMRFRTIVNQIYVLDHRMGHLEHDFALSTLDKDESKIFQISQAIAHLKLEHSAMMEQLSELKSEIESLVGHHLLQECTAKRIS